jgi:hypothetical protein
MPIESRIPLGHILQSSENGNRMYQIQRLDAPYAVVALNDKELNTQYCTY